MAKKSNSRSEDVKTPLVTIGFAADLFEAREDKWGKKNYGCTIFIPKTADKSALEKAVLEAATKQWGEKAINWFKKDEDGQSIIKSPFLDGDGKQGKYLNDDGELVPKPGHAGHWFIRCKSGAEHKPKVFDRKRNMVYDKDGCTSGSQGYAVVNAFTWENDEQGKGLTFGISLFQVTKLAEGEEVLGGGGGGPAPDKFFEKIEDEGDAPAETKGGAAAAGLFG
jgi:hypothetical protein